MGLALEEIRLALDDPQFDLEQALSAQRRALQQRAARTEATLRAIDAALEHLKRRHPMDVEQMFHGFDASRYEAEARQRWGHTDPYRESARRSARYTPQDWQAIKTEQARIYEDAARVLQDGVRPDDAAAMQIAERARLLIDRWFYPCSITMQCSLAELYEGDSRFAENIDRYAAGLTKFLVAAIRANAARAPE